MVGSKSDGEGDSRRRDPKFSSNVHRAKLPPYAKTGTERTPLVIHLTRAPPSSARNLKKYLVITAIVALHLVAGIYALSFLKSHWSSGQIPGPPPTYNVAIIGAHSRLHFPMAIGRTL